MQAKHRAFTLVELMVVIGIIGLLIAILLPSLSMARTQVKVNATKATFSVLDMGLEAFRTDSSLGGAYPPSGPPPGYLSNQAADPRQGNAALRVATQGAGLLAWGLVGADMLGTPGFTNNWPDRTYGGQLPAASAANAGLYTINTNTTQPFYARRAPFVDLAKINMPKRVTDPSNPSLPSYQLPAGGASTSFPGMEPPALPWIYFLDKFDRPILYYRANLGNPLIASDCRGDYANQSNGVYELYDNGLFTGSATTPGLDLGAGPMKPHSLQSIGAMSQNNFPQERGTFRYFIADAKITARPTAQRSDSYLLISAGPDYVYGTADDVTNFAPNY